ncbi:hypothetical protein SAMN05421538_11320 [Paracoccus isoporae]|uniref:MOSC domain-containing protein n=1 Tax=Paracoccus isoporae TaxID=591205 RepID=A0A1G7GEM0_9RHOB|nr:MOSC N-terminal beta barrel domain-containing protein [Paracoccus isoporae]SDE86459.1 hypothetical protein SAMN05421538_11320 [Paracoccus isoporae]
MARLAQIWRYPVKAIGRERLKQVRLEAGATLPRDRNWAVLHSNSVERLGDGATLSDWLPKSAFLRGAAGPALQAVSGGLVDDGKLAFSHPDCEDIVIDPADEADQERLIAWLAPLWPERRGAPERLVTGPVALTDSPEPFVSINSLDSLSVLESKVGERLGVERWRGNLWIEGAEAFAEQDWIGREIHIGAARLVIREPIGRCAATAVDTETGEPDRDMVRALSDAFGHSNFGVYAEVLDGAEIGELDEVTVMDAPADEGGDDAAAAGTGDDA